MKKFSQGSEIILQVMTADGVRINDAQNISFKN